MTFEGLESSLTEATSLFNETVSRRERLIKESRDIISLCAKSIVSVHTSNFSEARQLKKQAKEKLRELRQVAKTDLTKYLVTPEQEFVESSVILALVTESKIPSRKELGVSPSSYVLGLLDAIGELKRTVFDSIRKSDAKTAESMFSAMQRLYVLISPLSVYDNIAQGVKRKLDVARILIEDTRAAVTEDARRREFISAVNRLSERLNEELERSK